MLFGKSQFGRKSRICHVLQKASNSSLLPPFFLKTQGSSKNNDKMKALQKLCYCSRRKDFAKRDSILGSNYSQTKNVTNSIQQLYIEGSHLTLVSFDPARKAFEQPWNDSSQAEIHSLNMWKHFRVWTELLPVYSLPKRYRCQVAFDSRATNSWCLVRLCTEMWGISC